MIISKFFSQIIFEGVRGVTYSGDISLDDITIPTGPCTALSPTSTTTVTCNFEDASDPLCGFTQATDDVFDWTLIQGSTSTVATGPISDHTYSSLAGHYVYIETSAPRHLGDKARLISKVCFFKYMVGFPNL